MGVRNGRDYIEGLKARPRDVWVCGERVADVHPAPASGVEQLARLYDAQSAEATRDRLTFTVAETGERAGLAFMPAKDAGDLRRRREAYRLWAEMTFGLVGRSPDFLNVTVLAFWEARDVFDRGGRQYADNIERYYRHVRNNDLFLSHALITPQNDRSKTSSQLGDLHMRVVKETDKGIVVDGARMIATLGPISDEMIIYGLPVLKRGDAEHALMFAVPTDAEGLRQICREPYAPKGDRSSFDHPLSSCFEESDSLLIFKNVLVPWERVFCYRNVELANAIYPDTALRNHTAHQTNTRALVKMQLAVGVALAVARAIKADEYLHVQQMLGECLNSIEIIKSGLVRSEVECEPTAGGTVRASLAPLQCLRSFLPFAYPRAIQAIQKISAGGLMMMPTGADFGTPALSDDVNRFYAGASTTRTSTSGRVLPHEPKR